MNLERTALTVVQRPVSRARVVRDSAQLRLGARREGMRPAQLRLGAQREGMRPAQLGLTSMQLPLTVKQLRLTVDTKPFFRVHKELIRKRLRLYRL